MRLNSARQAWHDCYHQSRDSVMSVAADWARLGTSVQTTDRGVTAAAAMHQALAGQVQAAISTLHPTLQAFGNHLYSPLATSDDREEAESIVMDWLAHRLGETRMTAAKFDKLQYVANGVLYRYRRMNQGGQGAMPDPLQGGESFRAALLEVYGVKLDSRNWEREWQSIIDACFMVCNDLDRLALWPVAAVIGEMCEAA